MDEISESTMIKLVLRSPIYIVRQAFIFTTGQLQFTSLYHEYSRFLDDKTVHYWQIVQPPNFYLILQRNQLFSSSSAFFLIVVPKVFFDLIFSK
jgi:hypothetical protein